MLTQEQIGYLKSDDLYFYIDKLEDERRVQLNRNFNVKKIEVEIAHIQRELDHRVIVRERHQEFVKNNPELNEGW